MFRFLVSSLFFFILVSSAWPQSQRSTGNCSPNISDVGGNVNIGECTVYNGEPSSGKAVIPPLYELPFNDARNKLISLGWTPNSIKWNFRDEHPCFYFCEEVLEAGFDEVSGCAPTGYGECRFTYSDVVN